MSREEGDGLGKNNGKRAGQTKLMHGRCGWKSRLGTSTGTQEGNRKRERKRIAQK